MEKVNSGEIKEGDYVLGNCPFITLHQLREVHSKIYQNYEYSIACVDTITKMNLVKGSKKPLKGLKLCNESVDYGVSDVLATENESAFLQAFSVTNYPIIHTEGPIPACWKYDKMVFAIKSTVKFMEDEFKDALSLIKKCKKNETLFQNVVTPHYKGMVFYITLTHVKYQLLGNKWFQDELINDWGKLMNSMFYTKIHDRTLITTSFLYTKLTENSYTFSNVQNWILKKDLKDDNLKQVIFPINKGNTHWFLIVVRIEEKSIWLIDSMENKNPLLYFGNIMKCWSDYSVLHLDTIVDPQQWNLIVKASTPQHDGFSCGAFICSTMFMLGQQGRNYKYPYQWSLIFKRFMMYSFTLPFVFQYSDYCPNCCNWSHPKKISCKHMTMI